MLFAALTVTADDTTLMINPSNNTVSPDETFTIDVYCVPTEPIKSYELKISFDESLIKAVSITQGNIFYGFPNTFNSGIIDNSAGLITNIFGLIIGSGNTSNPGTFCTITFSSKSYGGSSALKFDREWTGVTNEDVYLSIDLVDGSVIVEGPSKPPPVPPNQPGPPPPAPPPIDEENHPPETPMKPSGPIFIELGVEYLFETSTFDIDEDEIRIKFDWGDGNFSDWSQLFSSNYSTNFSYVWNSVSNFSVRAIAQDEHGLNSSWSPALNVTVLQVDNGTVPIPNIKVIGEPITNETITFDASESFDPEGIIVSYYWDFGDGKNGTNETLVHKYQYPGEYIVTLTVTDDKGYNYSKSMTITVLGAGDEIVEQDSNDSTIVPSFLLRNLIIGIFIVVLILMIVLFRRNIKEFASSHRISLFSEIFEDRDQRKIKRLDNKINRIQEDIESLGISRKPAGITMKTSIDESMPKYVSADNKQDTEVIDKEDRYSIDTLKLPTGSKYDRFLLDTLKSDSLWDKSVEQIKDEEDIDILVDRLLLSKMLEKYSFNSVKDLEKKVNNHLISKDFDEDD